MPTGRVKWYDFDKGYGFMSLTMAATTCSFTSSTCEKQDIVARRGSACQLRGQTGLR
jgi:cold shock CspA family protein